MLYAKTFLGCFSVPPWRVWVFRSRAMSAMAPSAQELEHRPHPPSVLFCFQRAISAPPGRPAGCYALQLPDFGISGHPGKPDFGLLGWKSGDFGNLKGVPSPLPVHPTSSQVIPIWRGLEPVSFVFLRGLGGWGLVSRSRRSRRSVYPSPYRSTRILKGLHWLVPTHPRLA